MKSISVDIAAGLAAFMVVRLTPHIIRQHQDIRPFIVSTFLAFAIAALLRAKSPPEWRSILAVASSGIIPGMLLRLAGISMTADIFFASFLAASISGIGAGALTRLLNRSSLLIPLFATFAFTILVVPIAYRLVPRFLDEKAYQLVDIPVTPFTLKTLDGRTLDSVSLHGRVIVASFWATWCLPCQEELPKVETVAKAYAGRSDVIFVAVDSGTEGDTLDKVRSYVLRKKMALPIAMDSLDGQSPGPAATSLNLPSLPALYILDQKGDLRVIHIGYEASEDLEHSLRNQIDSLL